MLLRADDFIKSGDLSSARLLLERAAEAGDGRAALRLAGTFDPNVLKTLGFQDSAGLAFGTSEPRKSVRRRRGNGSGNSQVPRSGDDI